MVGAGFAIQDVGAEYGLNVLLGGGEDGGEGGVGVCQSDGGDAGVTGVIVGAPRTTGGGWPFVVAALVAGMLVFVVGAVAAAVFGVRQDQLFGERLEPVLLAGAVAEGPVFVADEVNAAVPVFADGGVVDLMAGGDAALPPNALGGAEGFPVLLAPRVDPGGDIGFDAADPATASEGANGAAAVAGAAFDGLPIPTALTRWIPPAGD